MSGVPIADYEEVLQQIIPSARLNQRGPDLEVQWGIRSSLNAAYAVNEEHATEMLRAFGEQIRARAIRELGLQPILDGYRMEADEFRRSALSLSSQLDRAHARIGALEAERDEWLEVDDE